MPKRRHKVKIDGRVISKNVPKKFRIGTRKNGRSAHTMHTDTLKEFAAKGNKNAVAVLKLRGAV